jgi:hypothetical protein
VPEEDLEPPIVRKRLLQELQCTEGELTKFLSILDEKARRMTQKLAIKEDSDKGDIAEADKKIENEVELEGTKSEVQEDTSKVMVLVPEETQQV